MPTSIKSCRRDCLENSHDGRHHTASAYNANTVPDFSTFGSSNLPNMGNRPYRDEAAPYKLFESLPDVLSTRQAADALGTNVKTLREMASRGEIGHFNIGRVIRFPKTALLAFVESGMHDSSGDCYE